MEEIGQIVLQLKMTDNINVITQDLNGYNLKNLSLNDFSVEEQAQLIACVNMIESK
jgi:hypothetical protein